ncbi:MAG: hypothetical protein RI920_1283, partial [Pseudomonadota bacterium]
IKQSGTEDYRYTVRFLFNGPNAAHIEPSTSEVDWDVQKLPWYNGPHRQLIVGMALYVALIVFAIWGIVSSSRGRPYATAEKIWKHLKQRQVDLKLTDGQIEDVVNSYLEGPGVKPGWLLRNRDKVAALLARLRSGGDGN